MPDQSTPKWVTDACEFIEANAIGLSSAAEVAAAAGVASWRLNRDFRFYLGFALPDYLQHVQGESHAFISP